MPLLSSRGVDRLRFGVRARRRAQLKRLALWVWLATLAAGTVGLPGADLGLELFGSLLEPRQGLSVARAGEVRVTNISFQPKAELLSVRVRQSEGSQGSENSTASPTPARPIEEIIIRAAEEFGLSRSYLLDVAMCESSLNPYAFNPAGYYGLFQFGQMTWAEFGYGSIYDPVAQARTAARLLAEGHHRRWPNCS